MITINDYETLGFDNFAKVKITTYATIHGVNGGMASYIRLEEGTVISIFSECLGLQLASAYVPNGNAIVFAMVDICCLEKI